MATATAMATVPLIVVLLFLKAGLATAWQSPSMMTRSAPQFSSSALFSSLPRNDKNNNSDNDNNNNDNNANAKANSGLSYPSSIGNPTSSPMVHQSSSSSSLSSPTHRFVRRKGQLYKDVVIVGGGLAGLSTALYLTQIDPERRITVLDKNGGDTNGGGAGGAGAVPPPKPSDQASMAAAGMLAPNSERLPRGDYRDLCLASKRMYTDFVGLVEGMAMESGPEGHRYLPSNNNNDNDNNDNNNNNNDAMEPWNVGYVASGGFLAPAFAGDTVATWAPPEDEDDIGRSNKAMWLDATQVRELEPHLHPDVVGGWWFPEDSSVDARRLTLSLKAACAGAGVEFLCGANNEVTSLDLQEGLCRGVWLSGGGGSANRYVSARAVLVANGAWMRKLLPVPLEPHKGQSISLRMPGGKPPILRRVLFGGDSYIVPKADGRIVLGATVEAGSFDGSVTPAGVMHVLQHALQLVPGLADLPIEETWAGLRPTTPDKGPILGETPWKNLYLAGGYWRNGVLLAPKTGELLAGLIANRNALSGADRAMLKAFAWDRFTSPGGGKKMAADSRYAASMYPVHKRKSGSGVAASVGTELGSYSTARSAGEERSRDRKSLEENAETEDLFERAAMMGKEDADVFEGFGGDDNNNNNTIKKRTAGSNSNNMKSVKSDSEKLKFYYSKQEEALRPTNVQSVEEEGDMQIVDSSPGDDDQKTQPTKWTSLLSTDTETPVLYDGSADAITVGSATDNDDDNDDDIDDDDATDSEKLSSLYDSIRAKKSEQKYDLPDQNTSDDDDKPDPGFRISHVDKNSGEVREIPPFTQPSEFFAKLEAEAATEAAAAAAAIAASTEEPSTEALAPQSPSATASVTGSGSPGKQNYDETTYDGYQEIFKANASDNRQDELQKMKEARMKNRSSTPPQEIRKKE